MSLTPVHQSEHQMRTKYLGQTLNQPEYSPPGIVRWNRTGDGDLFGYKTRMISAEVARPSLQPENFGFRANVEQVGPSDMQDSTLVGFEL